MRLTVDLDSRNPFLLAYSIVKGRVLLGKWPAKVRLSAGGRGVHLIWRGLPISQADTYALRYALGDDQKRIEADATGGRMAKQVLFSWKKVIRR